MGLIYMVMMRITLEQGNAAKIGILVVLTLCSLYYLQTFKDHCQDSGFELIQVRPGIHRKICIYQENQGEEESNVEFYSKSLDFDVGQNLNQSSSTRTICQPYHLLGQLRISPVVPTQKTIANKLPYLQAGGYHNPGGCTSDQLVAFIIPYRNRTLDLRAFLNHVHPILQRQNLEYQIFVVEQDDGRAFNKGTLFNAGFVEALKLKNFTCFILHDVDLYLEDDRMLYNCEHLPRHLSIAIDKFNYQAYHSIPYMQHVLGGVVAMTREQFQNVNGYSNSFWGWGGEDDDFGNRVLHIFSEFVQAPIEIARFKMIKHEHSDKNPNRFNVLSTTIVDSMSDGISTAKYSVNHLIFYKLYTLIKINLLDSP